MREKWKKYVEKFKSLGDKVSGVKGITAVIPGGLPGGSYGDSTYRIQNPTGKKV